MAVREQMLERPLPHSADAERAILGAIILDNPLACRAAEVLTPDDFYIRAHYHVFKAMLAMRERGAEINPILLGEELRREGVLEQVGGISFISELSHGLPLPQPGRPVEIGGYVLAVRRKSITRQGIKVANKVLSDYLEEEDEPGAVSEVAVRAFSALSCSDSRRPFLLTTFAEFMDTDFEDGEVIGFDARRGEVVLVQSVTNHGKSTAIRNSALALVTGGVFAPFVEAGEPRRVLLLNFEGSGGWFKSDLRAMTRDFTPAELELTLGNFLPTHAPMLDGEPLSLSRHMRALDGAVRHAGGVDVLIIDTVSAAFSIRNENDNAEIANSVMKPLVALARRLNCLIVLVHHVGKAKAEEGATREQAHRGRGASAWGDFSTSIFNLDADPHDQERVTVTCGKRKNGGNYERVLRLDRARRWFRASGDAPAKIVTNEDLVLGALEADGREQVSTGDLVSALAGKVSRGTVTNCLNRLADLGKVSKVRQGWWSVVRVCPTCSMPLGDWATCTNCGGAEKPLSEYALAELSSNGNGFHAGGLAGEVEV